METSPTAPICPTTESTKSGELPRLLGFWGVTAVMVGIIVGSGIFETPTGIANEIGSPWVILGLWGLGGVISLFGAFTYAELATMFPQSGGVYVFLREGYSSAGRCLAFVFGWTYLLITKPVAAAGIAIIFGKNLVPLIGLATHDEGTDRIRAKWLTSGVLVLLTVVNIVGVRVGTSVAGVLTIAKVAALVAITVLAFTIGQRHELAFASSSPEGNKLWYLAVVAAMSGILWTYDGWSDVGSMAGEVRNPKRLLPISYIAGTVAVTGVYLAINAAYFWVMSLGEMRDPLNPSVAPVVAGRLIGEHAGTIVAIIIVVSTLGSTHGSIMTGARISYAQSRDGLLFRFLGRVHPTFQTPAVSLWVQLVLSLAALWGLKNFKEMADGFVFTMWIFYGLAAVSIFTLRRRRPDAERPYRCWGYPVVPAIFVLASILMTVLSVQGDLTNPKTKYMSLIWLAVLFAGVPVYWIWSMLPPAAKRV